MAGHRLTAAERVRRRPDFERAYNTGARIHGRFMTVFVVPNGSGTSRFGVAATRKLGSAVVRNRAKRLARDVFRRHKVTTGFDIIIVPRRELLDAPYVSLEADYIAAIQRHSRSRAGSPHQQREGRARARPRI